MNDRWPRLSVIVPTFNESSQIEKCLNRLAGVRARGHELIVADGGSEDGTPELAGKLADRVLRARRGRARQMNAGAHVASGDMFLFLHADTRLPADGDQRILEGLSGGERHWGRFDVRLSGDHRLLRVIGAMMNLRSRLSGIATGDQGIFMTKAAFLGAGGFPEIPLMEDIAISRRLKRFSPPLCLREQVVTSSRRWERDGILRTVLLMWSLRLAFALGVPPERLRRVYYGRGGQKTTTG